MNQTETQTGSIFQLTIFTEVACTDRTFMSFGESDWSMIPG